MIVACLPDREAVDLVGVIDGVAQVVWDGTREPPDDIEQASIFVAPYDRQAPDPETLAASLPDLRVIQLLSAGYDAWLPALEVLRRRSPEVVLCNGRGVHGGSTAEIALALLLNLVRDMPRYLRQQADAAWIVGERRSVADLKVLVVGAGEVGTRITEALLALGADVSVATRSGGAGRIVLADVHEHLTQFDALVLALPLAPGTVGLVDAAFLAQLKDDAILVNVGRGPIIQTDDLLVELRNQRIRVGLDVTDPEPLPASHPLWHMPGVLLTPHVGGGSEGWKARAYASLVRRQLERLRDGEELANVVTL